MVNDRSPIYHDPLYVNYLLVGHPAYEYLDRVATFDAIALPSHTRPYLHAFAYKIRDSIIVAGSEPWRYVQEGCESVLLAEGDAIRRGSPWRALRTRLVGDPQWVRWLYRTGYHFASFSLNQEEPERQFAAGIQPVYGLEFIDTDDQRGTISRLTSGARFEGGYAGKLRFMMDFRDHTESGNGPYWSRDSLYEDRWAAVDLKDNSSTSYDISESFLQYYGHDLSIAAGRGRHQWGPAQFGSLFLNAYAPPFDYVRFDAVLEDEQTPRAIYYTFLHGFLESATPAESLYTIPTNPPRERTINAQKYLSAQRVEIRPQANMLFGFSQAVIYGDRGLQLGYLTPLNFLYSVQHSNDDKDNFVLGLDGTWRVVRGLKLYGEAFFDDIIVKQLTTASGSNKSAYTVGAHGIIPQAFWSNFDLKVEYTKIRPFVYTHFFPTNTYSHWTSPLGYTREPNSEFMTAELRGTFYPVQITLHVSRQNHGANTVDRNFGGDISAPNYAGNEQLFPFLAGHFERIIRVGVRANWEVLPNLFLFAERMKIEESNRSDRSETRGGFTWNL
jgi:hypothetical protein